MPCLQNQTRMEVNDSGKHSSLLLFALIASVKTFYSTGPSIKNICMFVFKQQKDGDKITKLFSSSFGKNKLECFRTIVVLHICGYIRLLHKWTTAQYFTGWLLASPTNIQPLKRSSLFCWSILDREKLFTFTAGYKTFHALVSYRACHCY